MSAAVKFKGKITSLDIGVSAGDKVSVSNVVYMRWNRSHDIVGAFVSSQKTPDHWNQKHSWIVWELALLGDHTAFTTQSIDGSANKAYDEDGDSYEIGYFVANYLTVAGGAKTTTFTGAIVATKEIAFRDTEDVITIVRGLAYYKTDA
jgi:hypothetical protein